MKDQLKRWKEHFHQLLHLNSQVDPDVLETISYKGNNEEHIMEAEIKGAMRPLKNNKAPGPQSVLPEVLKHGGRGTVMLHYKLFNIIWAKGEVPEIWLCSIIVPTL